MKKCFILLGLSLNFVGVGLLFFGLRADKSFPSPTWANKETGKDEESAYWVRESRVLLKIGLALIWLGLALQFYGTC